MKFKLIKSKKGITIDFLVMAMVVIVGFVLLSFVLTRFMASFDDKEAEILCHDSIALRGSTAINLGSDDSNIIESSLRPIPVSCRTIDVEIKGTREEVIKKVANKMARCWWMFGEGRYEEILHGSEVNLFPKLFGTGNLKNKCFNCYTLTIDQDEIEGGPIGVDELQKYMFDTKYEPFNFTYLDYFQDFGGPGRFITIAGTTEEDFLKARGAYAVSFGPKNHDPSTSWGWKLAMGAGLAIVAVAGVACIAATAGVCAGVGVAAAGAAGTTATATAVGLGYVATTATVVAGGSGALALYAGGHDILEKAYGERERSTIFLGWLEDGQAMCGSGDIAGE